MTALARRALRTAVAAGLAAVVMWPASAPAQAAAAVSVTIDYSKPLRTLSPADIGIGITGYGEGQYITGQNKHREYIGKLDAGRMRIELHYAQPGNHQSPIICGGYKCATADEATGDDWIKAIYDLGAEPVVILQVDKRQTAEVNRDDAVALYKHFVSIDKPVTRFILGNELNCTCTPEKPAMSATEYSQRFNMISDALKAENANVKVGGPAAAWNDGDYIRTFLQGSGSRVDFLDYHDYGTGGEEVVTDEKLLTDVIRQYETDIKEVSALAESVLGRKIDIQIGEFNSDYTDEDGHRTLKHFNTLWGAAAVGQILHAGASAFQYGDKNGPLGLTSTKGEGDILKNERLPMYHGIGMFTGESLFRPFGTTMVDATANNNKLHVFASDNAKNVVLVNVSAEPMETDLAFTGLTAGTAAIWQSTSAAWEPHKTGTAPIAAGKAKVTLPAASATTLVIDGQQSQNGLKATYFDNKDFTGASVSRVDPNVNFDWGQAAPDPAIGPDTFSTRWTGKVVADKAETYTFITTSDDGVRLWVDGQLIIDNWTDHSKRDDTGQIALTAGPHDIKMEYYDGGYDAIAQLHWSSPSVQRQIIPTQNLLTQ